MTRGGHLSAGEGDRIRQWMRGSFELRDKVAQGRLTVQQGLDRKIRLYYKIQPEVSMTLSGRTSAYSPPEKSCLIVAEFEIDINDLFSFSPEEEVVIVGSNGVHTPLGWEVLKHAMTGGLFSEMTFPSLLSAVVYADLTLPG